MYYFIYLFLMEWIFFLFFLLNLIELDFFFNWIEF